MRRILQVLIMLGVAVPLAAFVATSLVVAADHSSPRERIVIQDQSQPTGTPTVGPTGKQGPASGADDATDDGIRGAGGASGPDRDDERESGGDDDISVGVDDDIGDSDGDDDTDDDDDSGRDDD